MGVVETRLLTNLNQKLLKYPFQHFHLLQWYIPLVKFQQVSRVILLLTLPIQLLELPFICCFIFMYLKTLFIYSVFCLTAGPKPPLKRLLHVVRSRASSFK